MARARNIKPGLFKNEVLGVADPLYTLLFEGLWLLSDRAGRLEDRPMRIKAEVFPYRDGLDVGSMLGWLQAHGFIVRYVVGGLALIQIVNFEKHQNPHKNEPPSDLSPPDELGTTTEEIGTARADSGFRIPDSGCPALQPSAAVQPIPAKTSRRKPQVPLPEGFAVSARVRTWAASHGFARVDEHLEAFRRKATAKGYVYADWDSALMEAIREDWAKLRSGPNGAAHTVSSDAADKTRAMLDAMELTPAEKAAADEARKKAMAAFKGVQLQ